VAEATIRAYLDALGHELRYDPALARRVRDEVEAHLRDAAEMRDEGEAVASFGAPRDVAAQFAAVSMATRIRAAAGTAIVVFMVSFAVMQLRLGWYAAMHWPPGSVVAATLMRVLFSVGVLAALVGIGAVLATRAFDPSSTFARARLQRSFVLAAITTTYVIALLATDAAATAVRLTARPWSTASLVPLAALAMETLFASILVAELRTIVRARRLVMRR
jgi:uncharacterized membrane protein